MKKLLALILSALLLCSCAEQAESVNSAGENLITEASTSSDASVTESAAISTETTATVKEKSEQDIVCDTIMDNYDVVSGDDVGGIELLDLDFDGTPELIVSHVFTYKYQDEYEGEFYDREELLINADVYRIRDNTLVYIDTLYNLDKLVYFNGNILGLKTLENGDKAWFNMSYKNRDTDEWVVVDYLFTLDGDKLNFTEVFSRDGKGLNDLENASYNYFEEPLNFEVKAHKEVHGECDCDPETTAYYSEFYDCLYYKDSYVDFSRESIFGKGELFELFKAEWCADMSNSVVNLYSDWITDIQDYFDNTRKQLSETDFNSNILKTVEDFYEGENAFMEFEYRFLGDYAKPVIYLYPEETTDINVTVDFPNGGNFTCTYPDYGNGWNVTANPDGTLINKADGREYSYLYWEGVGSVKWDFSSGFVVKGSDTAAFLQDKLAYLGLKPREYNEFIVYWLPLMQDNPYNLITFQTTVYEASAVLNISPKPDSVQRVFMAYMPLEEHINIPEQQLDSFERTGFSVMEWGGTCVE